MKTEETTAEETTLKQDLMYQALQSNLSRAIAALPTDHIEYHNLKSTARYMLTVYRRAFHGENNIMKEGE